MSHSSSPTPQELEVFGLHLDETPRQLAQGISLVERLDRVTREALDAGRHPLQEPSSESCTEGSREAWLAAQFPRLFARAKILLARGMCQGAFARDASGERVATTVAEATSWSLLGALYRAAVELMPYAENAHRARFFLVDEAATLLCTQLPTPEPGSLPRFVIEQWGDTAGRSASEAIELIDKAASPRHDD
jgi:hypothetical protein